MNYRWLLMAIVCVLIIGSCSPKQNNYTTSAISIEHLQTVDSIYVDRWRNVVVTTHGDTVATHDTAVIYRYKLVSVADTVATHDTIVIYKNKPSTGGKGCRKSFMIINIVLIVSILLSYLVFKVIARKV